MMSIRQYLLHQPLKMAILNGLLILMLFWASVSSQYYDGIFTDIQLSTTERITKYGYPVETHEVTTEDGYIITIFRIPHGKKGTKVNERAIFMMPGLMARSEIYITGGMTNSSFAYSFADQGYDVWLANSRGGKHGRKHLKLDPKNSDFWMYSWHQIGVYDLAAIVDYILQETGKSKLYYIGHSQGGTVFYVLTSMRPEYQKKIIVACLLAPNGFSKHSDAYMLKPFAENYELFDKLVKYLGLYEFPPPDVVNSLSQLCFGLYNIEICDHFFLNSYRGNNNETDMRLFPLILSSLTTVATFQIMHYAQALKSRHFRQWDFGKTKNIQIYGSPEPPDYPVENIEVPMKIFYSLNDIYIFEQDVNDICHKMPGCNSTYRMRNPQWTHIDFLFSINLEKELIQPMIEYMKDFKVYTDINETNTL